ncbi:murein biosynthesis integral membrane protein MurJ [Waterburya agarophytonicola K14]|uniref:Probable lipid II flippase MurJ n=1 Tax=Waterburya agarophytonicola KI4 TaxID=2874699 RepID=A0A964BQ20_9CYAN|nr:murein biosynthesis integral membrane protein MurJ [Waterburya agarophytonicola KI4]
MTANKKTSPSVGSIAKIVAIATLVSKLFGLIRQQVIATAFGISAVTNAYTYAYNILPSFFLVMLGGINGPFHSALVSVLAKKDRAEAAPIVETVTTLVSLVLSLVTVTIIIFAPTIIDLSGAQLSIETKELAVLQLRIMAPLALLAGLIGIGFGTLSAVDSYLLPSISPLLSSVTLTFGVVCILWKFGEQLGSPEYFQIGAIVLAGGTLGGAVLQWLAQLIVQWKAGMGTLRLRFDWRIPGVMDVFRIMTPAVISSGMSYVNLTVDLLFVSGIAGAAFAITTANFIMLTPVGLISNIILVPFLPVFSRLAAPENWRELKVKIRQGLFLGALSLFPLTAIFMSLALPIVKLAFERGQFTIEDSQFVASLLVVYGFGMIFYISRDILVRVFYALGDGKTPFKVSIVNILLNAALDYVLIEVFNFGAPGLLAATIGVNIVSTSVFIWILHRRLNGLPLVQWSKGIGGLVIATILSGLASYGVSQGLENTMGNSNLLLLLIELSISSAIAIIIFGLVAMQLKLPELDMLTGRIKQKLGR